MPSSFPHFRAERLFRQSVLQVDLQCDDTVGQSVRPILRKSQADVILSTTEITLVGNVHTCSL
jgi:hypothetical protein